MGLARVQKAKAQGSRAGDGAGKLRDAVLVAEIRDHGVDGVLPRRVVGHVVQNSAIRRPCTRSSISVKPGLTPASSGKRRRTEAQKEWIVWIFSPPGVSMARAKSVRARDSRSGSTVPGETPTSASDAQFVFRRHRPVAEAAEQTVLHLHRRGLGIGQAEDAFGRDFI
jgi:hypothetical protein